MVKIWSAGASSLSVEHDGCVAIARYIGTLNAKLQSGAVVALKTHAAEACACVIDLRGAWVADTARNLAAVVQPGAKPVALLVPPELTVFYDEFAWHAAMRGVVRAVFTAQEPAVSWARREAALLASSSRGMGPPSSIRRLTA